MHTGNCTCLYASPDRGFYDRKKLFWKDVEDTTLCAACAPPGGGRQEITPRFVRHFTMLCVPPPSDAATKTILMSIFNGFLADFPKDMATIAGPIVNCSVEAYNRYGMGGGVRRGCGRHQTSMPSRKGMLLRPTDEST